jgi:hypothetical protein
MSFFVVGTGRTAEFHLCSGAGWSRIGLVLFSVGEFRRARRIFPLPNCLQELHQIHCPIRAMGAPRYYPEPMGAF